MKYLNFMLLAAMALTGCRDASRTHTSVSILGHHIQASVNSPTEGKIDLIVTLSNSSTGILKQDAARGDSFPPNIVQVFLIKPFGREAELPLTRAGTRAYLKGELWSGGHYTSRPIELNTGDSTNWIYHLDQLFSGITQGTYRIVFVPSAISGFGKDNPTGKYFPFRTELASSNLFITIPNLKH